MSEAFLVSAVPPNTDAVALVVVVVGRGGARRFGVGLGTGVGVRLSLLSAALISGRNSVGGRSYGSGSVRCF